jgi:transposase
MDTSQQTTVIPKDRESTVAVRRQQRSIAEKRRIVEETLVPGASVARVARAYGVNANQVFGWRRLYLAGRLGEQKLGIKLLPVRVSENSAAAVVVEHGVADSSPSQAGTIRIELRQAQVRIEGSVDPSLVRVMLECLRA